MAGRNQLLQIVYVVGEDFHLQRVFKELVFGPGPH